MVWHASDYHSSEQASFDHWCTDAAMGRANRSYHRNSIRCGGATRAGVCCGAAERMPRAARIIDQPEAVPSRYHCFFTWDKVIVAFC